MTSASSSSEPAHGKEEIQPVVSGKAERTRAELEALPQRKPPLSDGFWVGRRREPGANQPHVIISAEAVSQIATHGESDTRSEVGGVLLGHAYRHEARTYVEVRAALPAVTDDHGPIHFTFNADAWAQIHSDRARRFPELDIVGWYHSHPSLGVFFSADDAIVHSAAFVLPWHVALVVDPVHREFGLFGWDEAEVAPLPGLTVLRAEDTRLEMPWRFMVGEVWEETYQQHLVQQGSVRRRTSAGVSTGPTAGLDPWLGVLVGALGILLSLGMLFGGILPLTRHSQALEAAVLALSDDVIAQHAQEGASCPDAHLRIVAPGAGQTVSRGASLTVVGTADVAVAHGYLLEAQPAAEQRWWSVATLRRDVRFGLLAQWDVTQFADGDYLLRLVAVDRQGDPLADISPCVIPLTLGLVGAQEP